MPPNVNITTTTNQYLAPAWVDQVLRDNFFFGEVLSKTEKWDGSQMLFPKLIKSFVSLTRISKIFVGN
jgi:hypothetical protein